MEKVKGTNKFAPLNMDFDSWLKGNIEVSEEEDKLFKAYLLLLNVCHANEIMNLTEILEKVYIRLG
jgi:intergrase/recombinase